VATPPQLQRWRADKSAARRGIQERCRRKGQQGRRVPVDGDPEQKSQSAFFSPRLQSGLFRLRLRRINVGDAAVNSFEMEKFTQFLLLRWLIDVERHCTLRSTRRGN
jgi:hypothetical protein